MVARWRFTLALGLGLALACSSSGGGPTGPTEGTLEVITSTSGSDPDPDGYTLTVDTAQPQALPERRRHGCVACRRNSHRHAGGRSLELRAGRRESSHGRVAAGQHGEPPVRGRLQPDGTDDGSDP